MKRKKIRVVIDTNWWVSFVINRFKSQLSEILLHPGIEIYASEELDQEIIETLHHKSLEKYIKHDARAEFLFYYHNAVVSTTVKSEVSICRDPKDNFLLALVKDAQADYLLTGDQDLLVISNFEGTKILKMGEFLEELSKINF